MPVSENPPLDIPIAKALRYVMQVLFSLVGILLVAMYVPFTLIGVFYDSPTAYKTTMLGVLVIPALAGALVLYWKGRGEVSSRKQLRDARRRVTPEGSSGKGGSKDDFITMVASRLLEAKESGKTSISIAATEMPERGVRTLDTYKDALALETQGILEIVEQDDGSVQVTIKALE